MKEIVANTTTYIELLTGEKVEIKPLDARARGKIPLYLTGAYDLYTGSLLGRRICFAFVGSGADTTPAQYAKRAQALYQQTSLLPVFVLEKVASYNAQRLTRHRVNFIIPGKQMFLPALLMDLGETDKEAATPEAIPATAQLMILYHLEVQLLHEKSGKEIAEIVGVSKASTTRAIQWLVAHGFAEFKGGKRKYLRFFQSGRALWDAACEYMTSPVLRTVRTDMKPSGLICGQNALAEYGMLVEANHEMVAISPGAYNAVKQSTDPVYGENEIQVWRYNPSKLAKSSLVDRLSLYLSMRESADERVQKEIKALLKEMIWLED